MQTGGVKQRFLKRCQKFLAKRHPYRGWSTKTRGGDRWHASLLNHSCCHDGACGAMGQEDLTYATSAVYLLNCLIYPSRHFSFPKPFFTFSSLLLEKSIATSTPAYSFSSWLGTCSRCPLLSCRDLGGSISRDPSPRPAAAAADLPCTLLLHYIHLTMPSSHLEDDSVP